MSRKNVLIFILYLLINNGVYAQVYVIKSINGGYIKYDEYVFKDSSQTFNSNVIANPNSLHLMIWNPKGPDFTNSLLQNGYATIVSKNDATKEQIDLQDEARKNHLGVWEHVVDTTTISYQFDKTVSNAKDNWLAWLIGIIGFLGGPIALHAYYKERRLKREEEERKKRLPILLLGETSAGKTSLYQCMSNTDVTEDIISKIRPTKGEPDAIPITSTHLPNGSLLIPTLKDVAGSDFSGILNCITGGKNRVVVYVLALNRGNDKSIDTDFAAEQYGTMKPILALFSAYKLAKEPEMLVLFINKLDLIAECSLSQTNSSEIVIAKHKIEKVFERHITYFNEIAKKLDIESDVIIGSSLKFYKTDHILKHVRF